MGWPHHILRVLGIVAVIVLLIAAVGTVVGVQSTQADDNSNEGVNGGETENDTETADEETEESDNGTEFVVEQGEECTPIEPLSYEDDTAEEFYGYVDDRSSPSTFRAANTPVGLERRYENASSLFLYEDDDGISLVFIHDRAGHRGAGDGAASMRLSEVPAEASWTVRDDPNDDDEWRDVLRDEEQATWVVHWQWGEGYTDGGVLKGGFDEDISVRITPGFNDDAGLISSASGTIDQWQVLSGNATDPERTTLDMNSSITVQSGTC